MPQISLEWTKNRKILTNKSRYIMGSEILCYICYIASWWAVIPAIIRIFRRRSSTDYSKSTMIFNFTYNLIWLTYVILNPTLELIVCSMIDLILAGIYLFAVFRYYDKDKK